MSLQIVESSECDFNDIMFMMYRKSMQSTTLQKLLRTPMRPELLLGDPELRSIFFSSSDCPRRGEHVASLSREAVEYQVMLTRVKAAAVAYKETVDLSKSRMQSAQDPFRTQCPGCEAKLTVDYDAWDVTEEGTLHVTCPKLDLDPSAHILHEDVNPSPVVVHTSANDIDRIHMMAAAAQRKSGSKRRRGARRQSGQKKIDLKSTPPRIRVDTPVPSKSRSSNRRVSQRYVPVPKRQYVDRNGRIRFVRNKYDYEV